MSIEKSSTPNDKPGTWLDKTPIPAVPWLTVEVLIFAGVILLAILSRFYNLGERVMSHDESLHTYYSWLYSQGQGYQHNPMMHGPLQFHLIALTYFIFGASDFTARIPAAVFSILAIISIWKWRYYLGRTGTIVAGILALISPILLFYGRYTREDPYVPVSLFIMLYSILRYLETGKHKYIYLVTGALIIHFLTKETAFIYCAIALIYLAIYFVVSILRKGWEDNESDRRGFMISMGVTVLFVLLTVVLAKSASAAAALDAAKTASPALPSGVTVPPTPGPTTPPGVIAAAAVSALALAATLFFLIRGYGLEKIRQERSFDLLILIGILVLPMLSAFAMSFMQNSLHMDIAIPTGEQDLNSFSIPSLVTMGIVMIAFFGGAALIGWWWKKDVWWRAGLLFYAVYTLFYTSLFTNGAGFFTGTVGSLGYWLSQQGVARGSQPWYYYVLIQIPVYEFLPAIACLLALYFTLRPIKLPSNASAEQIIQQQNQLNMSSLLGWWTFASILAFTLAGEKMPWLTLHMALPMVLWGGWALGKLIDSVDWADLRSRRALLVVALAAIFTIGLIVALISFVGDPAPFSGKDLAHLQVTATFLVSLVGALVSAWGLFVLLKGWSFKQMATVTLVLFFAVLGVQTIRTSIRANYILYDTGMEYLVYAHGYTGVKDVLRQVTELSNKTTGDDHAIVVAYDDDTSWPLSWYMRDFKNAKFYGGSPGVDLREVPAIIVGNNNYSKIEPIVGDKYYQYDYIRMVWPNQDYFNLTSDRDSSQPFPEDYACTGVLSVFRLFKSTDYSRLCNAVGNPQMREAIFDIWLNRDYTKYATVTGSTGTTLANWDPSDRMRLYIRKDVAQLVWKYGAAPVAAAPDPYVKVTISLASDLTVGGAGTDPGLFNAPRQISFAPDGSLYVADSRNHRIEHFDADGKVIKVFGAFGDNTNGKAPGGTLNEPWGVAVGPDGSVYVSDTWNHRVQKFDANGTFIKMWGTFGLSDAKTPSALYGPRGIAVDAQGHVYVADTGNKRIAIFDADGKFLAQFGSEGFDVGQFSEPTDVQLDAQGNVYVTDTWNQRVQVFSPSADGLTFTPLRQWPVENAWKSQSLDNKPYIAIAPDGHVYVTDPEGYRVIEYTSDGKLVQTWGAYGTDAASFGLSSGIAVDAQGRVWVSDAGNNRLLRFTVPAK